MSTETPSAPAPVVIRHEFAQPPPPAAKPADREAEPDKPKPERIRVKGSDTDFRELSLDDYMAQRQADEVEGIRKGVGRALKALGVGKREREAIFKELLDEDNGFEAREGVGRRLVAAKDLEDLQKLKGEYDGAKGKLEKFDAYEKAMLKIADSEMGKLPEAAQKRLKDKLPKDADAATRIAAIEDYKALLAELGVGASGAEKEKAAAAAAASGAEKAAEAKPGETPAKPATTGGPAGPAQPKGPGTLNELQVYEDLTNRGFAARAADYFRQHSTRITQLMRERSTSK